MDSPVSLIIANLFLADLESRALANFTNTPWIWWRYVDDTFVILDKQHVDSFLQYLNDQCNEIKFTLEYESQEKSIAFRNCKATYKEDKFVLSVYCKKIHSDKYLNFTSAHPLCMKRSVVNMLTKRVLQICLDPQEQQNELQRLESVLAENDYPTPIINQVALQVCSPYI